MPPAKRSTAKDTGKKTSSAVVQPVTQPAIETELAGVVAPADPDEPLLDWPAIMQVVENHNPAVEGGLPKRHFDEIDVAFALARHTEDGKGDDPPPPSDFTGFPTEGVIKEE